jgi:thiamine biosynthesis protein ThiS
VISVNGSERELEAGETLSSLLEKLGVQARYALVELNGEPVERGRYADAGLREGDVVVVARPVAGG